LHSAERFFRAESAVFESAHGVFAADEEALTLRHTELLILCHRVVQRVRAAAGQREDVPKVRVEAQGAAARQLHELRDAECRPEGVNGSTQRTAGIRAAETEAEAARGVERIVARVV